MKIPTLVCPCLFLLAVPSQGQTPVSFGQALSGPITLPNGTIVTANVVTGTHGTPGPNNGATFINNPSMGGEFNGTVFDGTVDPYYATRLEVNPSQSIDNGITLEREDFIGFRVHFSTSTEISSFYFLDLDGTSQNNSQEWAASFAYDGPVLLVPTLTVPSTGSNNVTIGTPAIDASWNTLVDNTLGTSVENLPASWTLGQQLFSGADGERDPDQSNSQMKVTYTSKVTDLFVIFGIRNDRTGLQSTSQNSGIAGFTAVTSVVPEPSSLLMAMGAVGFAATRRRRAC